MKHNIDNMRKTLTCNRLHHYFSNKFNLNKEQVIYLCSIFNISKTVVIPSWQKHCSLFHLFLANSSFCWRVSIYSLFIWVIQLADLDEERLTTLPIVLKSFMLFVPDIGEIFYLFPLESSNFSDLWFDISFDLLFDLLLILIFVLSLFHFPI
jgi:hypothetical protein